MDEAGAILPAGARQREDSESARSGVGLVPASAEQATSESAVSATDQASRLNLTERDYSTAFAQLEIGFD